MKQLVGFQSVALNGGQKAGVEFTLNPCEHLSVADVNGQMLINAGSQHLVIGDAEYPISIVLNQGV